MSLAACCIHIFVQVLSDVDTLLFSLLILKSLTDSNGQIWHCLPLQYYVIEVTYIDLKSKKAQHKKIFPSTISLLEVLPTVTCVSPLEVLQNCKAQNISKFCYHDCMRFPNEFVFILYRQNCSINGSKDISRYTVTACISIFKE